MEKYDIAVIGSGPGGFAAAVRAAQLGAKTVIIEKGFVGGTCLNCGCIPTKFMWQALKTKLKIKKAYEYGLEASLGAIQYANIVIQKNKRIANIRKGMEMILSSYEIPVISGAASFKDKNTLLIGTDTHIKADKIIIASCSEPHKIPGYEYDGEKIINSTDALNLEYVPETLLIIGGGAIGVEMATIFAGFGSKVTIAESFDRLLPSEDAEISNEIMKNMSRQGIEILVDYKSALNDIPKFQKALIVTGRIPAKDLNLENAGIDAFSNGFIKVNKYCQTNFENIYAVGDTTKGSLLAYTAQNEGAAAAEKAFKGKTVIIDNKMVPRGVFSMPQSASVKVSGFKDDENIVYGIFPLTASGRAFIEGERTGFIKCAADKNTKKPLAFWMVGTNADEIINTASMILTNGINHIARESLFHPSISEGLLNAYEDAFGKCTEIMKKK